MKITRDGRIPREGEMSRAKATSGCDTCPICGQSRNLWEACVLNDLAGGYVDSYELERTKGIFRIKVYKKIHYVCHTCNTEWDSDEWLDHII